MFNNKFGTTKSCTAGRRFYSPGFFRNLGIIDYLRTLSPIYNGTLAVKKDADTRTDNESNPLTTDYRVILKHDVRDARNQRLTGKQVKALFKDSTAQITISVGCSKRHEGESFRDTLEKASQSFEKLIIMVDDSIQWRTNAINNPDFTEDQLKALAIQQGDQWLANNQKYIDQINLKQPEKVRVVLWRNWEKTDELDFSISKLRELYMMKNYNCTGKPHPIKEAIDTTAHEFLRRKKNQSTWSTICTRFSEQDIINISINYLIEECAVMAYLWPTLGTNFELYPSKRSVAMAVTFEHLIKPIHPNLLQAVTLSFSLRSQNPSIENNCIIETESFNSEVTYDRKVR